jgi:hypothetical protein
MKFLILFAVLLDLWLVSDVATLSLANVKLSRSSNYGSGGNRGIAVSSSEDSVYLLISTSSKLYCMRMPELSMNKGGAASAATTSNHHSYKLNHGYYDDIRNYEVIYEEKAHVNNWITDAFYVKSENLIYVNVYNSTSASSDIFTLKYDTSRHQWIKHVLYKDQSYCLGIAYNEEKRELYWTAARSILAGSSVVGGSYRILFNLDLAKKLLYLKYDAPTDSLYVSTLNYIYACSLQTNECRIIVRDLVSARGVYLDANTRHLYVVDHKKRNIKRTQLDGVEDGSGGSGTSSMVAQNTVTTLISPDTVPDIGDIFYMTIYRKNNLNMLIWSEFSGKIKISSLNDTSNYRVVFSTNEYTYSVNIMDNSTHLTQPGTTTSSTTTPTTTMTTTEEETTTTQETSTTTPEYVSTTHEHVPEVVEMATTTEEWTTTTEEWTTTTSEPASTTNEQDETTTSEKLQAWTRNRLGMSKSGDDNEEPAESTIFFRTTTTDTAEELLDTDEDDREVVRDENETEPHENIESQRELLSTVTNAWSSSLVTDETTDSTTFESTTTTMMTTTTTVATTTTEEAIKFIQKLKEISSDDESDDVAVRSEQQQQQVQNLRGVNVIKPVAAASDDENASASKEVAQQQPQSSSSSYNLIRSGSVSTTATSQSHQLNLALYIVICLLCFSLVINIILLYVSKMRQQQQSREKLIITHEICDKSETMPSQRSGLTAKMSSQSGEELTECNINLINHNGSATSDGDQ